MTEYGSGGSFTVRMDGPYGGGSGEGGGSIVKLATISAPESAWKGGTSPYSQEVHVDGISVNSVVEINLDTEQIEQIRSENKNIAFTTENDAGMVTLIAIGSKPSKDLVFQAKIVDVLVVGDNTKLLGNTITIHQESLPIIGGTMKGALNMGSNILTGLPAPVNETDAVRKNDLEKRLSLAGGTMTGDINMNSRSLYNVKTPSQDSEATPKGYVDTTINTAMTNAKTKVISKTLTASGWSDTAPYKQNISVDGLTDELRARAYPVFPTALSDKIAMGDETAKIRSCTRSGKIMTFECWEEKPAIDIPIVVEVSV